MSSDAEAAHGQMNFCMVSIIEYGHTHTHTHTSARANCTLLFEIAHTIQQSAKHIPINTSGLEDPRHYCHSPLQQEPNKTKTHRTHPHILAGQKRQCSWSTVSIPDPALRSQCHRPVMSVYNNGPDSVPGTEPIIRSHPVPPPMRDTNNRHTYIHK
jgi:hypothetical protein